MKKYDFNEFVFAAPESWEIGDLGDDLLFSSGDINIIINRSEHYDKSIGEDVSTVYDGKLYALSSIADVKIKDISVGIFKGVKYTYQLNENEICEYLLSTEDNKFINIHYTNYPEYLGKIDSFILDVIESFNYKNSGNDLNKVSTRPTKITTTTTTTTTSIPTTTTSTTTTTSIPTITTTTTTTFADVNFGITYLLNPNSMKVHRENCSTIKKISNYIRTNNLQEALNSGYVACKVCRPS